MVRQSTNLITLDLKFPCFTVQITNREETITGNIRHSMVLLSDAKKY